MIESDWTAVSPGGEKLKPGEDINSYFTNPWPNADRDPE